MASLPERSPVRLLIVGPPLSGVERRIAGAQWDAAITAGRLYVTGVVDRAEVAQWAGGADVIIMPSADDGMANGLLEGMALGLCPIASGVFDDVIRAGETGALLQEVTTTSILTALMEAASDRAATRRLGIAAAAAVTREHRAADEATTYLALLNEVLNSEP
jgi:glycosyltransferase involved in cell wall biosynthesis